MKFVDFFITKPLPRQVGTPRINSPLLALEIKSKQSATEEIVQQKIVVDNAILQLAEYCETLSSGAFARVGPTGFIPAFLVYGQYYSKLQFNNGLWDAEPFQFVFE
jgi:hypothetical protein